MEFDADRRKQLTQMQIFNYKTQLPKIQLNNKILA